MNKRYDCICEMRIIDKIKKLTFDLCSSEILLPLMLLCFMLLLAVGYTIKKKVIAQFFKYLENNKHNSKIDNS